MTELEYSGKTILAPMVRVGTLPMRLLALKYGADIVYTEEIVDYGILQSNRVENEVLGTVDFISSHEEQPIFRTFEGEKPFLVFQVGTSDPERAVKVATFVENDVSGFDVNMGCPKPFSVQGGMGAALLKEPEKVKELEKSLELCHNIERCGVKAVAVHGRRRDERQQHSNRNDEIREIARALCIPVIANGGSREIRKWEDIERFRKETECSSVMLARAAQDNVSIFRKEGLLPLDTVVQDYLRFAVEYDAVPQNIKYVVQRMIGDQQQTTERGRKFLSSVTQRQICKLWGLDDYFVKVKSRQREKRKRQRSSCACVREENEIFDKPGIIELEIAVPKERNKKFAEQAAAMVALDYFGLRSLLSDDFWEEDVWPI